MSLVCKYGGGGGGVMEYMQCTHGVKYELEKKEMSIRIISSLFLFHFFCQRVFTIKKEWNGNKERVIKNEMK